MINVLLGILIPFIGTMLGSTMVFLMKNKMNEKLEKFLLGFAGGVMMAASIWSLIIPSIEQSENLKKFAWIPAMVGILFGVIFLFVIDVIASRLQSKKQTDSKIASKPREKTMMMFAVTLHNIPEGMAVGVALAGAYFGHSSLTLTAAIFLSVGIAIQNFPEGAIISMPLKQGGMSKSKSFFMGTLSGVVEPIAAILTFFITGIVSPILPYILSFAAGAMIFVVVKELVPESQSGNKSGIATFGFTFGFVLMMILDVALS